MKIHTKLPIRPPARQYWGVWNPVTRWFCTNGKVWYTTNKAIANAQLENLRTKDNYDWRVKQITSGREYK